MKPKTKTLILSLILDDLIHAKLLSGLQSLGLPTDDYTTDLSSTILELMQFEGELNDQVFLRYLELRKRARLVDLSTGNFGMRALAGDIYEALLSYR